MTGLILGMAAAAFISPGAEPPNGRNVAMFERTFTNRARLVAADWHTTAQGVYEIRANGQTVGTDFLKPGYTECGKCRHEYAYDVLPQLHRAAGASNVLSATVSPGWWCDQLIGQNHKLPWQVGRKVAFRGELRLAYADGTEERIATDERWLSAYAGPLKSAGIYEGEVYDATATVTSLCPSVRNDEFQGEIRPAAAKVTLREDLTLAADRPLPHTLRPGELFVVDFGQNCAAVPCLTAEGPSGTTVEMRFAEMLNEPGGDPSRGNDGPGGTPYLANLRGAYAGVKYTLRDGRQTYRPAHTYFGYRYASLRADAPVRIVGLVSVPVSSVTPEMEIGSLETGDRRINRLVANVLWGLRSNYLSIPTDCPQRDERLGWTADTQVFAGTALYLCDCYGFLMKYLDDMADCQRPGGAYGYFVPNCRHRFDDRANAGWADAGVILPYRLWKRTGRTEPFVRHWAGMLRYMDYLDEKNGHDNYENADWLAFEHTAPGSILQDEPYRRFIAAVLHIQDAAMMREMASASGDDRQARRFAALERELRQKFAADSLQADGTVKDAFKGQTSDVFALRLRLCRDAAAEELTRRDLVANVHAHGDCLQTGFLGTPFLLPVLTDEAKRPDLAYTLLLQDKCPSWLYSVDQGATTVWERWNSYTKAKGFGPVSMNSFNHYAYGSVVEWLFAYAAGIRADPDKPGFSRFVLAPVPDRRLGHLTARFRSPVGMVESAWSYAADGRWKWRFTVPTGTIAEVRLPDGRRETCSAGTYERTMEGKEEK